MSLEDNLRIVSDLGHQKEEKLCAWLRYLVGLASGALTVLLALGKGIAPGTTGTAQRVALTSLALGILLGSLRLYVEVSSLRAHARNLVEQANRQIDRGASEPFLPSVAKPSGILLASEYLCYLSLAVALVALVFVVWTLPVTV